MIYSNCSYEDLKRIEKALRDCVIEVDVQQKKTEVEDYDLLNGGDFYTYDIVCEVEDEVDGNAYGKDVVFKTTYLEDDKAIEVFTRDFDIEDVEDDRYKYEVKDPDFGLCEYLNDDGEKLLKAMEEQYTKRVEEMIEALKKLGFVVFSNNFNKLKVY